MKRKFEITDASGGAAFSVRVVTRAAQTEVVGIQDDGVLKVRLTSAPEEGANDELLVLLAEVLEVDKDTLEVVAGEKGRDKLISVDGIAPEVLEQRLISTSGGSE